MADRIVTLRRAEIAFYWALGIGVVAVLDWLLLALGFDRGAAARTGAVTFSVGFALLGVWVLIRCSRAQLVIGDSEILIRNPFRTVVVPRSELRRLTVSPDRMWIFAETSSGEMTRIWVISSGMKWTIKSRAAKWNAALGLDA